jgi:hypothetical protein
MESGARRLWPELIGTMAVTGDGEYVFRDQRGRSSVD